MNDRLYLPGPAVDRRYAISSMTRYRWQKSLNLGFPEPVVINGRKYWSIEDLEAWERRCSGIRDFNKSASAISGKASE